MYSFSLSEQNYFVESFRFNSDEGGAIGGEWTFNYTSSTQMSIPKNLGELFDFLLPNLLQSLYS